MDAEAKYWKDKWTECIRELDVYANMLHKLRKEGSKMKGKGMKKKGKKGC